MIMSRGLTQEPCLQGTLQLALEALMWPPSGYRAQG